VTRLPVVSGRDVVRALGHAGYITDRQKGSHIVLRREMPPHRRIVVPDHDPVAKGTLRAILRETGITVAEFATLLER
jgi:predicted RNA binding protein YcfA (HicA-like mRNA interferase family)